VAETTLVSRARTKLRSNEAFVNRPERHFFATLEQSFPNYPGSLRDERALTQTLAAIMQAAPRPPRGPIRSPSKR